MSDDPIGWKIVATYDDGSVLCEAPNGKRCRYQFVGTPDEPAMPPLHGNVYHRLDRTVCTSSSVTLKRWEVSEVDEIMKLVDRYENLCSIVAHGIPCDVSQYELESARDVIKTRIQQIIAERDAAKSNSSFRK